MAERRFSLANDIDGDQLDAPEALEIELDMTVDTLRPFGPGGYRLDAIDEDGSVIEGVVVYTEVHDAGETRRLNASVAPDDHFGRLVSSLEHMPANGREFMEHCLDDDANAQLLASQFAASPESIRARRGRIVTRLGSRASTGGAA